MMMKKMRLLQREEKLDMRAHLVRGGYQLLGLSYTFFDWTSKVFFFSEYSLLYIMWVDNIISACCRYGINCSENATGRHSG